MTSISTCVRCVCHIDILKVLYLSGQELGLRLLTCISMEEPAYLTEMHQVAALLFSLLPTLNCKPTSLTFDFYVKIRKVSCST